MTRDHHYQGKKDSGESSKLIDLLLNIYYQIRKPITELFRVTFYKNIKLSRVYYIIWKNKFSVDKHFLHSLSSSQAGLPPITRHA